MTIPQLVSDEPLSPELVLVLPPELRAQVLTGLREPVRPARPLPIVEDAPGSEEPFEQSLGQLLASRILVLGAIFAAVTLAIVALALVARAIR